MDIANAIAMSSSDSESSCFCISCFCFCCFSLSFLFSSFLLTDIANASANIRLSSSSSIDDSPTTDREDGDIVILSILSILSAFSFLPFVVATLDATLGEEKKLDCVRNWSGDLFNLLYNNM